jgi:ADP-heptose:LPS heptosyltransferase
MPVIALHPGGRGSSLAWPIQHFVSLAEQLIGRGVRVIVTGVAEEAELTAPVAAVEGVFDLTGQTTLGELAWIYKECDSVVANSTGPLHLGAAVGTKVVGIYPAAQINSPVRWGPFGPGHMAFRGPVDNCPKCIWEECPFYNCLELVPVSEVVRVTMGVAAQSPHVGEWRGSVSAPAYSHQGST